MPVGLGPRFLIEAGFIVGVAVVAGVERFRTVTIVLVVLCLSVVARGDCPVRPPAVAR